MTLQEREAHACAIIDSMAEKLREVSLYLHLNFQSYKRRYGVTITVLHSIK